MQCQRILATLLLLGCASAQAGDDADDTRIRAALGRLVPDMKISSIAESRVPGLYEVVFGAEVVYMTADGRYLLRGDLLDLGQHRNLSEDQRISMRREMLSKIPKDEFIEFAPAHPTHTLYVFTDIDCGFCRRLHQNMPAMNANGIAVRYLAFPRAGIGSSTFKNMESVWCAPDRNKALTEAKLGHAFKGGHCKNPVARQYTLGERMGVHGTPALFEANGKSLGGYMSVEELLTALKDD